MEVSDQLHAPATLSPPPRERAPGTYRIEDCVGPGAGLDAMTKRKESQPLPGIEPHP